MGLGVTAGVDPTWIRMDPDGSERGKLENGMDPTWIHDGSDVYLHSCHLCVLWVRTKGRDKQVKGGNGERERVSKGK